MLTLKSLTITAAGIAAGILIDRIAPALAAGLVAMAHELHPESARAEAVRRAGGSK